MIATKFIVFLCLVGGSLALWQKPNWRQHTLKNKNLKYPALPRSVPVFNFEETPYENLAANATCAGPYSCADCHTAQVCRPSATGFVPISKLACPGNAPYCNAATGSCSDMPDPTCGSKDTFICSGNGYFPDPTNCTIYHACNDYESQMFKCAAGEVYDPDNAVCSTTAVCNFGVACPGVSQSKLQMGNTHYYTYCSNGTPLMVSRCQREYKLNTTSQMCEAICEKNGLMEDAEDCTKFYMCQIHYVTKILSYPLRQNLPCPTGEVFDPNSYQCVPKTQYNCTTTD